MIPVAPETGHGRQEAVAGGIRPPDCCCHECRGGRTRIGSLRGLAGGPSSRCQNRSDHRSGGLVSVFLLRALVALVTQRRDEETLALMVEESEPGFRSRLIASVQFAQGKATVPDEGARLIVERMVEETESFARPLKLADVVNTRPLKRTLLVLLLV